MRRTLPWLLVFLSGCGCGDKGKTGAAGSSGADCWDVDGDGVDDPGEDVNGDGAWDAADCAGGPGDPGDPGDPGADGDGGPPGAPCWDLDGDGVDDPEEDVNGDLVFNAADCSGVSTGSIGGTVIDADTRALVEGATVTVQPGGVEFVTLADGQFLFEDLPFGLYDVTATGASLEIEDDLVVEGLDVVVTAEDLNLHAGETLTARVPLGRLDREAINLTAVHDGDEAIYDTDNCEACHSDRSAETTADETEEPFHAISAAGSHASQSCTFCHTRSIGVDVENEDGWGNESAGSIRKQVDINTCVGCHSCYPGDFCALADCPDPCP